MCLSFLDNHDFVSIFVGVDVVLRCCMLRIVFISWQTVVCLLNSTALRPGEGPIPDFHGVCRLHLSAG